jgi:hypothetical protein
MDLPEEAVHDGENKDGELTVSLPVGMKLNIN